MPYCTAADLQANIAGLSSDSKKVPEDFLDSLIEQKTAHINAMICNLYQVPITEKDSPTSFQILKEICINLCRARVAAKMDVRVAYQDEKKQLMVLPGMKLAKESEMRLELIQEGRYKLPDAVTQTTGSVFGSGSYDLNEVNGIPITERPLQGREFERIGSRGGNC